MGRQRPAHDDAITDAYQEARQADNTTGLREFFREKKHQGLVLRRFEVTKKQTARHAKRAGQSLNDYLELTMK
jgi:hypothetical protein